MPYTEPASFRETSTRLGNLSERLRVIRKNGRYRNDDARYIALTHCREAILASRMVTTMLANVEERRLTPQQFQELVGVGPAQQASEKLSEASRLGLVVLCQFQIENLLKNLIASLGGTSPRGYYKIGKDLVGRVSLSKGDYAFRILYTPALIRNSFHSNGYHKDKKNPSWSLDIDGCMFTFTINKKISCAGWGHIIQALNAVASVTEEVLQSPEIVAIPGVIQDQYPNVL